MPKPEATDQQKCSVCGRNLEMGYGLAGGGMGPYLYCDAHGVVAKFADPEMNSEDKPVKDT